MPITAQAWTDLAAFDMRSVDLKKEGLFNQWIICFLYKPWLSGFF